MRPKRRILLIDSNEVRSSCTAFQLRIWGYSLATPDSQADLILAFTPVDEEKMNRLASFLECPLILVWDGKGSVERIGSVTLLTSPEPALFLEYLNTLSTRKRKRGPHRVRPCCADAQAHTHIDIGNSFQVAGCPGD